MVLMRKVIYLPRNLRGLFLTPIFFSAFIVSPLFVHGQTETTEGITLEESKAILPLDYPVPDRRPVPFEGEDHRYSVVFRGNGEAVITLRVALSNTDPEGQPLREVSLRLPEIIPSELGVYQIIAQGYCLRYDQGYQPRCLEYSEPDYFNYYGGGRYQRAKFNYLGDTLTIALPQAIEEGKTGSYFVYFRAAGVTRKNILGAYKYTFESLKTGNSINSLTVGISTDSDLFLKGVRGEVDYRFDEAPAMMKMEATGQAVSSTVMDSVISQTGQGKIMKKATNLAPLETYKVRGMYADSRIKLWGREIAVSLASILLVAAILIVAGRKLLRKKLILYSLGMSFVSSVILAIYTTAVIFLFINFNYMDYQTASLLGLFGIIFSFCFYLLFLFIPGIYFGYKKGAGWGILTVVLTVFWLFIYFMIAAAIIFLSGYQGGGPIVPMMQNYSR